MSSLKGVRVPCPARTTSRPSRSASAPGGATACSSARTPAAAGAERWRTVASGHSAQPFVVEDDTGTCIVQPDGALILAAESTTWYGDLPWPRDPPGLGNRRGAGADYRYFEERIHQHELVYALGQFRTVSGADAADADEAVRALLATWKQDAAGLARRFDQDGDGTVSLAGVGTRTRGGATHASSASAACVPPWPRATCSARRRAGGSTCSRPSAPRRSRGDTGAGRCWPSRASSPRSTRSAGWCRVCSGTPRLE